ncbi:hypothetical protein [Fibrella aquatilis]|uniref:Uncharacterized protein n=1 Tax=Fibrella aquatilis TaxID=2817059 RepID=A0A939K1D1_9BACT|nr:hypothetical protein [Fibrella aquatilis]MBO0932921.1 hypothetical protein [Fibrella aquatilis]
MKKVLNQPLQTAGLVLAIEVILTMTIMVIRTPAVSIPLLLILLIVVLFGISYMVYALVDSSQRGRLKLNLILAVCAPPAYIFLLFVYVASRVTDDL